MEEMGLSLYDLIKIILKKWVVLLVFLFLGVSLGVCYTMFIMKGEYTSKASLLVVMSKEEDPIEYDYSNSLMIINTVSELSKQSIILKQVAQTNEIELKKLENMISVTNPESSLVLNITVKAKDGKLACKIANEVTEALIFECSTNPNLAMVGNSLLKTSDATSASYTGHNKVYICLGFVLIFLVLGCLLILSKEFLWKKADLKAKNQVKVQNQLENI